MRLLALDPGFSFGWSLWDKNCLLDCGQLNTSPKLPQAQRLQMIMGFINSKLVEEKPDVVAIENVIVGNYKSADAKVSCLGTFILAVMATWANNIPLEKVAVQSVKKYLGVKGGKDPVTGKTINTKKLIVAEVNRRYGLSLVNNQDDTADAVAIGATYLNSLTE